MAFQVLLQEFCSDQFEAVIQILILEDNELKKGLDRLSDVHEKLSLIESFFEKYNLFGYLDSLPESNKSDELSITLREGGNHLYEKKEFAPALVCYNISLICAKHDSINFFLGCSNRSAVLYKMGRYQKCLEAIEEAKKCSLTEVPAKVLEKLEHRRKECIKNLCREVKQNELLEFKLSYPKHQKCSHIANCLELKKSVEAHNFFYTTRNLRAGDVVSVEPFFCSNVLLKRTEKFGFFCFYCLKIIIDSAVVISCPNCADVDYCSVECRLKDWDPCHKYLCSIAAKLTRIPSKLYLALKVSLLGRNIFKNISELNTYCKSTQLFSGNIKDEKVQQKEYYKIFYNKVNSGRKTDKNDLSFLIHLALVKRCLFKFTEIKFENKEEEKLFINLIVHNYNDSTRFMPFKNDPGVTVIGPISELFYHSCSPNVEQFVQEGRIITLAIKPIKANEVLTKTWGYRFYDLSKLQRQAYLKNNYGFTCSCEACRNNYGILFKYGDNPAMPAVPAILELGIEELRSKGPIFVYSTLIKYLQQHGNNYPCRQLILTNAMLRGLFVHKILK